MFETHNYLGVSPRLDSKKFFCTDNLITLMTCLMQMQPVLVCFCGYDDT